jgi:hypothetical protein
MKSGLSDGIFSNQKSQFGSILEGLTIEDEIYFMGIWSISRPFGMFNGHLVYFVVIWYNFSRFGVFCQEKSDNPV